MKWVTFTCPTCGRTTEQLASVTEVRCQGKRLPNGKMTLHPMIRMRRAAGGSPDVLSSRIARFGA